MEFQNSTLNVFVSKQQPPHMGGLIESSDPMNTRSNILNKELEPNLVALVFELKRFF